MQRCIRNCASSGGRILKLIETPDTASKGIASPKDETIILYF
jgi:hypothetical protein